MRSIRLAMAGLCLAGPVFAQAAIERGNYLDQLAAPELRSDVGRSGFDVTTDSDGAQEYFNHAMALYHDFQYLEAFRAFKEARRLDPDAAMPAWGVALSLQNYASRERADERKDALAASVERLEGASEREQLYIRALAARDSTNGADRYKEIMGDLIERFPEDVDARLLLATAHGWRSELGRALLRDLHGRYPDHAGVQHYWLHSRLGRYPEQAIEAAERLADLAPGAGHIVHMPGHVYFEVGRYHDAAEAFLASQEVEAAYMASTGVLPADNGLALHNLNFLVVALEEAGRTEESRRWTDTLVRQALADPDRHSLDNGFPRFLQGTTVPARVALRYGRYDEAVTQLEALSLDPDRDGAWTPVYRDILLDYARANLALGRLDADKAARHTDALEARLFRTSRDDGLPNWTERLLGPMALELRARLAEAAGDVDRAVELMERAVQGEKEIAGMRDPPYYVRPTRLLLADVLRRAGRHDEAVAAYERFLEEDMPASAFGRSGLAASLEALGREDEAAEILRQVIDDWATADPDHPLLAEARARLM